MDDDGSWLKGPGKVVTCLWTVNLTPPKFQMAVRHRCKSLSVEGKPARVMEAT